MTTKKKATKKKTAGPKLVEARAAKKRTGTLPGMSTGDEELNSLARVYVDGRDARLQAGLTEKRGQGCGALGHEPKEDDSLSLRRW